MKKTEAERLLDTLEQQRNVDITTVNPVLLKDIQKVKIDESLPEQERVLDYLQKIKNPYCFKCGDIVVKVSFSEKTTLDSCLRNAMYGV